MLVCIVVFISQLYAGDSTEIYKKENFGSAVNTVYDEILPVISPDGKTLYFCRRWHPDNTGNDKREDILVS